MPDEVVSLLIKQNDKIFIMMQSMQKDIATLTASKTETDKLDHERRISKLENTVSQWLGSKALFLWLITTGIAVYAAMRR